MNTGYHGPHASGVVGRRYVLRRRPFSPQKSELMRFGSVNFLDRQLRCSRERPTCSRCRRHSLVCHYPQLVDRKLLAAQRGAARAERVIQGPDHPDAQLTVDCAPGTERPRSVLANDGHANVHSPASPIRVRSTVSIEQGSDCDHRLVGTSSGSHSVSIEATIGPRLRRADESIPVSRVSSFLLIRDCLPNI